MSGTRIKPSRRPVEVERDEDQERHQERGQDDGVDPSPDHREVEAEQPERDGGPEDLHRQDGGGHTVPDERRHAWSACRSSR